MPGTKCPHPPATRLCLQLGSSTCSHAWHQVPHSPSSSLLERGDVAHATARSLPTQLGGAALSPAGPAHPSAPCHPHSLPELHHGAGHVGGVDDAVFGEQWSVFQGLSHCFQCLRGHGHVTKPHWGPRGWHMARLSLAILRVSQTSGKPQSASRCHQLGWAGGTVITTGQHLAPGHTAATRVYPAHSRAQPSKLHPWAQGPSLGPLSSSATLAMGPRPLPTQRDTASTTSPGVFSTRPGSQHCETLRTPGGWFHILSPSSFFFN